MKKLSILATLVMVIASISVAQAATGTQNPADKPAVTGKNAPVAPAPVAPPAETKVATGKKVTKVKATQECEKAGMTGEDLKKCVDEKLNPPKN